MYKKLLSLERVASFVGFIFLSISFVASLILNGDVNSVIELLPIKIEGLLLTQILIPTVHFLCAIVCLVIVFKPSKKIMTILFLVESVLTILTSYEQLGIFLFHGALILILISDQFTMKSLKKVIILCFIHILSIFGLFRHGWTRVFVGLATTSFYFAFFMWIYAFLKNQFSCFLPKKIINNEVIKEKPGDVLSLSNYGLSERQIKITIDHIKNKTSYKELSEKYYTSLSSIKKDFSIIFKKFNVSDLNELSFLLVQFSLIP